MLMIATRTRGTRRRQIASGEGGREGIATLGARRRREGEGLSRGEGGPGDGISRPIGSRRLSLPVAEAEFESARAGRKASYQAASGGFDTVRYVTRLISHRPPAWLPLGRSAKIADKRVPIRSRARATSYGIGIGARAFFYGGLRLNRAENIADVFARRRGLEWMNFRRRARALTSRAVLRRPVYRAFFTIRSNGHLIGVETLFETIR